MADNILRAWAYLSRVTEPPCPGLVDLVARVGPEEAADRIRRADVDERLVQATAARREIDCGEQDLEIIARLGGRLITPSDEEWPVLGFAAFAGAREKAQAHPPLALWAVGPARCDDVADRAAAVVGTRTATSYGEHVAAEFAAGLAAREVAVVSGGAFGIDATAHRATLGSDGVTVAVLAGGIDVPYPSAHTALLRRIAERGLLVTEYPPGLRPARHRFLTRNRLVAALAGATVVVEAGIRSGAASTAAWARALGRPVCAVPGPITSSVSAGCHVLLRDGAELVTRPEEVIELVGRAGELAVEQPRPGTALDDLDEIEARIYDALPGRGTRTADEIAVASGIPAYQVLGPLAMLEVAGLVVQQDGCWKLAGRRGRPSSRSRSYSR